MLGLDGLCMRNPMRTGLICLATAWLASCSSSSESTETQTPTAPPWSAMERSAEPERLQFEMPTPLSGHPMTATEYGYKVTNPIAGLTFHFRRNHVAATRRDSEWTFSWRLTEVGRAGRMTFARPAAPHVAECEGEDCLRLEYRRATVTEWYMNTAKGIEQGFDIAARPDGAGPLVIRAEIAGLVPRPGATDDVIVFDLGGDRMFTYSGLLVIDAVGRSIPASFKYDDDQLSIVVHDAKAVYPIVVDPTSSACPASWCDDGDDATTDVCSEDATGSPVCTHALDVETLAQSTSDGGCDPGWCNDGDPNTTDTCTASGSEVSCDYALDPAAIGAECTFGEHCCAGTIVSGPCDGGGIECPTHDWCNDGDPTTIDVCQRFDPTQGTFECQHVFDAADAGEECTYGDYCCFGTVAQTCDEDGPGADCPDDWCNDGDPTTNDTCSNYKTPEFECAYEFDENADGRPCSYGKYCCDGAIAETCPSAEGSSAGAPDPIDGICTIDMEAACPTTTDSCGAAFTGAATCTDEIPAGCGVGSTVLELGTEQVTIELAQDVQSVSALFAHAKGASGVMMFLDADGGVLGLVTSRGGCEKKTPASVAVSFPTPARTILLSATDGAVYLDDLRLTTP